MPVKIAPQETISVSLVPALEELKPVTPIASKPALTRPTQIPAIVAKENSPVLSDKPLALRETSGEKEKSAKEPAAPSPPVREKIVIAERKLPALKDLVLPPLNWSSSSSKESAKNSAVSLNTTDPTYMTYVAKIRNAIESEWQYPEVALRHGLQGKLALVFTILGNGQLEGLRLVRSSGSAVLDEEALRAIKAASPFPPIPPWIKPNPLAISATMEYRDNRLDYRFIR
jgi:protein TonB